MKKLKRYFSDRKQFSGIFDDCIEFREGQMVINKPISPYFYYRWPKSENDMETISELNTSAFRRTSYADTLENKKCRNIGMWNRNPYTFLMIDVFNPLNIKNMKLSLLNETSNQLLYFSCILPITEIGYKCYFHDRLIGDRNFRSEWIAKPDEKANSILLFSFARDLNKVEETGIKSHELLPIYLRALAYHLDKIHQVNFNGNEAIVHFQNNDNSFRWLADIAGFEKSHLRSKDNEIVYTTTLSRKKGGIL